MAPVLRTHVDPRSAEFAANREALLAALADLDALYGQMTAGGGTDDPVKNARTVARHRSRGKLLPRERISLLLDRGSAFLELSPLAGWGTDDAVGAGLVVRRLAQRAVQFLHAGKRLHRPRRLRNPRRMFKYRADEADKIIPKKGIDFCQRMSRSRHAT